MVDMEKLRSVVWNGIPETIPSQRAEAWKILLEYQSINKES
jgi:hypothetical protein